MPTPPVPMSDLEDNDLFAISLYTDNVATTSTSSASAPASRTYQSEADFQKIKSAYQAKIDNGNTYQDLITAVPVLAQPEEPAPGPKVKLSKRDVQLVGYAAAELYYDRKFARVIELCERVKGRCEIDGKLGESLERWTGRCEGRLEGRVMCGRGFE